MTSKVSIVIPVYNVEDYLAKCLDSVINQTYSNIEIILVNDGSTDNSSVICQNYANKDNRINLYNKKNGGLSDARNYGLELATGEWVSFIDSDDFVNKNFISNLLLNAQLYDADISVCNYLKVHSEEKVEVKIDKTKATKLSNITAMQDLLTYKHYGDVMTWNKLYKLTLFKNSGVRFPKGKIHEDNFTTYKLYHRARNIIYFNEPLYYYLQREGSIMNKEFDHRRLSLIEAADGTANYVNVHNLPLMNESIFNQIIARLSILSLMYKSTNNRSSTFEKKLIEEISQLYKESGHSKYFRLKDRVRLLLLLKTPYIYSMLVKLIK